MSRARVRQSGQIAVMVTLALPILLGMMSLCTDVAAAYSNWAVLRKAADSAALAGAGYLMDVPFASANAACGYPTDAQNAACTYAIANNVQASEIQSITVANDSKSITLVLQRSVPAFFARVVGFNSFPISVTATAGLQPVGSAGNTIPVGLQYDTPYVSGQQITIHYAASGGPGNWSALALGGNGANIFQNNMTNNYPGTLTAGMNVASEPGATVGAISKSISTRLQNGAQLDLSGTYNAHSFNDPRAVLVPLVDWTGCNGKCASVPLKGFAELWLIGSQNYDITVTFIGQALSGTATTGAPDAGAYHVALLN